MSRPISPELVLFPDFWVSNIPRYFCFAYNALNYFQGYIHSQTYPLSLRPRMQIRPLKLYFLAIITWWSNAEADWERVIYINILQHAFEVMTLSTQVLLCLFPGVLWLWHFLYSVGPHPVSSLHIYTFFVSWRVRLAKQETLTPPGHLVSPLVCRVRECPPWCSIVMPQWQCISSFVFYTVIWTI